MRLASCASDFDYCNTGGHDEDIQELVQRQVHEMIEDVATGRTCGICNEECVADSCLAACPGGCDVLCCDDCLDQTCEECNQRCCESCMEPEDIECDLIPNYGCFGRAPCDGGNGERLIVNGCPDDCACTSSRYLCEECHDAKRTFETGEERALDPDVLGQFFVALANLQDAQRSVRRETTVRFYRSVAPTDDDEYDGGDDDYDDANAGEDDCDDDESSTMATLKQKEVDKQKRMLGTATCKQLWCVLLWRSSMP